MSLKLSVKELSEITNVSKRNIRYYDSIDLFKASGTLENGYRYYGIEKIEELRLISYLRYVGIPVKEIFKHLQTRNIDEYSDILSKQIDWIDKEMIKFNSIKTRLKNKLTSIDYTKSISSFDQVLIKSYPKRQILRLNSKLSTHLDWEQAMLEIEENIPPSLTVGDNGFIVDMSTYKSRDAIAFSGVYIIANDPFTVQSTYLDQLDAGDYLTMYLRGNHEDARLKYFDMVDYAKANGMKLGPYGFERMLIDDFLSSDDDLHIIEIQIPIIEMRHNERLDTR